jgi:hypothetical protein
MNRKFFLIFVILTGLLLLIPQQSQASANTTLTSPTALWHMDEGSGSTVSDSIGTDNGTLRSDMPWAAGIKGSAVQFNGAWNNYIAFSPTLNVTDEMTVETWVNPGFDPADPSQYAASYPGTRNIIRKSSSGDDTFWLALIGRYRAQPYLSFAVFYNDGSAVFVDPLYITGLMQKDHWYHIVGTFKRNNFMRVYINGVEQMAVPTEDKPIRQSSRRLVMGQLADIAGGESSGNNDETWIGLIDDTAIYNQALTGDEVKQHYVNMLDKTPPVITINTPVNNATYLYQQVINADYNCTDSDSGVATCNGTVPGGSPLDTSSVGWKSFSVTGTDNAANTATSTVQYGVNYGWSGFLQPINADGSSIFKLGSTVPVKFQLTGASAGISNAVAKLYIAKIDNGIDGTDVEAVSTATADSGNTFRYDSTSQQYIFNLGTKGLTTGTYRLKVYIGGDNTTGVLQGEVIISLKK